VHVTFIVMCHTETHIISKEG